MSRVTVVLPDELTERARKAGIDVSEICQSAVLRAVELRGKDPNGQRSLIEAAIRLRAHSRDGQREDGIADGREWATTAADLGDLHLLGKGRMGVVADPDDPWNAYCWKQSGTSLRKTWKISDTSLYAWLSNTSSPATGLNAETGEWTATAYAEGFVEGARRTWVEVEPFLSADRHTLNDLLGRV